jgi:hypothetical protein
MTRTQNEVRYAAVGPDVLAAYGDDLPFNLDLTGQPDGWDDDDRAAVDRAAAEGAEAVWRVWAYPRGTRHHLVLAADGGITADDGVDVPVALAYSALLWTAGPVPEIRVAALYDQFDEETGPTFSPDHPRLDPRERAPVLAYLQAGAPLLTTTSVIPDVVDPAAGELAMHFRTDGTWIWAAAAALYLDRYGLAPDAGLLAHLRDRRGRVPDVGVVALHRALAALQAP